MSSFKINDCANSSTTDLPLIYGFSDKIKIYFDLAKNVLSLKIVNIALKIFNSEYFQNLQIKLQNSNRHILSSLNHSKLPEDLKQYLVVRTTNLPSLHTLLEKKINPSMIQCFDQLKTRISQDLKNSSAHFDEKYFNRLNESFDQKESDLKNKKSKRCLSGVCHAMVGVVANAFLENPEPDTSLSKIAKIYNSGVDGKVAGMQAFFNEITRRSSFIFRNHLQTIDSLLEINAVSIQPSQLDLAQEGLFHVALPFGLFSNHSILLKLEKNKTQILDPNFGVFEFPTLKIKDFFKRYISCYESIYHIKITNSEIDSLISKEDSKIFTEAAEKFEVRQMQRSDNFEWNFTYSGNHVDLIWNQKMKIDIVEGQLVSIPVSNRSTTIKNSPIT